MKKPSIHCITIHFIFGINNLIYWLYIYITIHFIFFQKTRNAAVFSASQTTKKHNAKHTTTTPLWCVHGANLFSGGKSIWVS